MLLLSIKTMPIKNIFHGEYQDVVLMSILLLTPIFISSDDFHMVFYNCKSTSPYF
jgi:hypothetical protein